MSDTPTPTSTSITINDAKTLDVIVQLTEENLALLKRIAELEQQIANAKSCSDDEVMELDMKRVAEIQALESKLAEAEQERDSALNDRNNWRHHAVICSRPAKEINERELALEAQLAAAQVNDKQVSECLAEALKQLEAAREEVRTLTIEKETLLEKEAIYKERIAVLELREQFSAKERG